MKNSNVLHVVNKQRIHNENNFIACQYFNYANDVQLVDRKRIQRQRILLGKYN